MKPDEFDIEWARLKNRWERPFNSNAFKELVIGEFLHLDVHLFRRVVDKFIGEYKDPPLLPQFRTELTQIREQEAARHRVEAENDAQAFWNGSLHPDEIRDVMGKIKRRLLGKLSDQEFEGLTKTLKGLRGYRGEEDKNRGR